jgi:hypothetical protein
MAIVNLCLIVNFRNVHQFVIMHNTLSLFSKVP